MAHLAVEPSLGHPVREVGDAKGGDHTDKTIREFGKCARNPAHYATSGQAFEWGEFLFMENHFRVLGKPACSATCRRRSGCRQSIRCGRSGRW